MNWTQFNFQRNPNGLWSLPLFISPMLMFVLFAASMVLSAIARPASAQQDWSHLHPPPVKVAPLKRRSTKKSDEQSVTPATHIEPMLQETAIHDTGYFSGPNELPPSAWRAPPHRTIEAPQARPAAQNPSRLHSTPTHGSGYPSAGYPSSGYTSAGNPGYYDGDAMHGNTASIHSMPGRNMSHGDLRDASPMASLHDGRLHHGSILPELPGVENDPSSAGPGHLGMGTHWIRNRPTLNPPIPGATVAPRWKAPYSYGHFGAEPKRSWTRQYGYRDRYLQWSLR